MTYYRYAAGSPNRFIDAKPVHAGMERRYLLENLKTLMDESPAIGHWPIINGPPSRTGTAYNDAAAFARWWKRYVRPSRIRLVRGFSWKFRAEITAGGGTGSVRFWAGGRDLIPGATPPDDFVTVEKTGIAAGPAEYGPFTLTLLEPQFFSIPNGNDADPRAYPHCFIGAQAIVSAGGTTIEITDVTFREVDP